jgi:hypothetical protein
MNVRLHRMVLRRYDGLQYLSRWGAAVESIGGIYLHRMDAPDPGLDLHDHPWSFVSIVLWGGYSEERAFARDAPSWAMLAEAFPGSCTRGVTRRRRWLSVRALRLDECHRVTELHGGPVWTLVLRASRRRQWGFYLPSGWMHEREYDNTVRAARRDLWNEVGS